MVPAWFLLPPPPNRASSTLPFWPDRRLAMAFTSTVTHRCPDGSGFILDPLDGDDTIFMPLKHLVAGDPVAGDTVSYDVDPLQGVAYNVKAVVPEPCPVLQRRGRPEVFARSDPAAAAAAMMTTAAELGEPAAAPGRRKQRLNPKRRRTRSAAPIAAGPDLIGEFDDDDDDDRSDGYYDLRDYEPEPAPTPSTPSAAAAKSAAGPMQLPWLHSRAPLRPSVATALPVAATPTCTSSASVLAAASAKSAVRPTPSPTLTSGACSQLPAAPGTVSYRDLVQAAEAAGQTLVVTDGIFRQVSLAERAAIEAIEAARAAHRGHRV